MRKYISLILIIAVVFTVAVPLMADTNTTVTTVALEEQVMVDINGDGGGADKALMCWGMGAMIIISGGVPGGLFILTGMLVAGCFG